MSPIFVEEIAHLLIEGIFGNIRFFFGNIKLVCAFKFIESWKNVVVIKRINSITSS